MAKDTLNSYHGVTNKGYTKKKEVTEKKNTNRVSILIEILAEESGAISSKIALQSLMTTNVVMVFLSRLYQNNPPH